MEIFIPLLFLHCLWKFVCVNELKSVASIWCGHGKSSGRMCLLGQPWSGVPLNFDCELVLSILNVMLVGTHGVLSEAVSSYCYFYIVMLRDCFVYHKIRGSGWTCAEKSWELVRGPLNWMLHELTSCHSFNIVFQTWWSPRNFGGPYKKVV